MSRRGPMKKKKFIWSDTATDRLVKMWVGKSDTIKGYGKNTLIHQEMANELKDYGPTPIEIKAKLDCMKKRYRRELGRMVSMQDVGSDWRYFDSLHHIYKHEHVRIDRRTKDSAETRKEVDRYEDEGLDDSEGSIEFFFPELVAEEAAEIKAEAVADAEIEPEIESDIEELQPVSNEKYFKRKRSILRIEQEKIAVQKETLNIMRSMVKEISNFHASFLITYKTQNKKRST
ncbi:hypothetical protein KR074_001080 [Drosophila pseudoananassae]|nr:hypothetical protein KR074_001080 [Drosophila pseudoananassae]